MTNPTGLAALELLLQQKMTLEEQIVAIDDPPAKSDEQKAALKGAYARAVATYEAAATKMLVDDETALAGLVSQGREIQRQVEASIAAGDAFDKTLTLLAGAVGIGTSILTLLH
jgi:hypothetical protein